MACPLFLPDTQSAPLTDLYGGECAADPGASIAEGLLQGCNQGYARGTCCRAAQSDADAFRFIIRAHRDNVIDVAWSSERDHHPVAGGMLSVSSAAAGENETEPLERQARIWADAYIRQIGN